MLPFFHALLFSLALFAMILFQGRALPTLGSPVLITHTSHFIFYSFYPDLPGYECGCGK
jgi:hypothetical protein